MYAGQKLLALIPARGGSKGIKNKNIVDLAGKPLIAYSIEAALHSNYIDQVVVTTDSAEIAEVSRRYGASVPFLRPVELARDTSKTIDAVLHALKMLSAEGTLFDVLVLLQPTQPLRTAEYIDQAIKVYFSADKQSVVSVAPVDDNPLLMRTISSNGKLVSLLPQNSTCRRQDMPTYFRVNGCIYINSINEICESTSFNDNTIPFFMSKAHSVDIDEECDLVVAEYYLRHNFSDPPPVMYRNHYPSQKQGI